MYINSYFDSNSCLEAEEKGLWTNLMECHFSFTCALWRKSAEIILGQCYHSQEAMSNKYLFHLTSKGALQLSHNHNTITQASSFSSPSLWFPTTNGERLTLPNLCWLIKDTESDCLSLEGCSRSSRNTRYLFWVLVQRTWGKHPFWAF